MTPRQIQSPQSNFGKYYSLDPDDWTAAVDVANETSLNRFTRPISIESSNQTGTLKPLTVYDELLKNR